MRLDKYTIKAQESINETQSIAQKMSHQQIEPEHLLKALLEQVEGLVVPILWKIGCSVSQIKQETEKFLEEHIPKVYGGGCIGEVYLSPRLAKVLEKAQKEAEKLKDEYISTEHLLLGIVQEKDGKIAKQLRSCGATSENIYKVLKEIRGTQRVVDQNPEDWQNRTKGCG